ncbi:hypothetical protein GQ44DRAFT_725858 [Phaeosphaeriaceae sp. PMI808]|nr:hypothetical protein GQ44DRAFT_725858 [Phaeosphaeriaceae sp. PMI808]
MPENTRMAFQRETESKLFDEGNNRHDATQLSNRARHKMLWDTIFCDYKWIDEIVRDFSAQPFLVGTRLDALHLGSKDDSTPPYAALISGDISGDVTYTTGLFFSCLMPHKSVEGTDEILFDSGIILNISDILACPELIPADIQQLLYDGDRLGSTYSFWKGVDDAPRRLESPSLTLTKSRIPGDEQHFWILKLKSEADRSDLEVFLKDSKKSEHGFR